MFRKGVWQCYKLPYFLLVEVSRRTIQRDIDALCEMGIPIAADLGVTGGYSLPPDYTLPPLALTLHEALLLRLALSSLSQLSATPFKQERESLLAKIQTLLPQRESEHLDMISGSSPRKGNRLVLWLPKPRKKRRQSGKRKNRLVK